MPKLIILRGEAVERELDLGTQDVRVGRGAGNDLILEDPTKAVSRFHAEIRPEGGGWVLIDLNSQNGTWIDGRRIQKTALAPGVTVSVGPYHLKYHEGQTASTGAAESAATGAPAGKPSTDTLVSGKMRTSDPSVVTKSASALRPSAKPVAKAKGGRPVDDNIVSRLVKNKPLLFGGFGAFMLLVIIAGQLVKPSSTPASATVAPAVQDTTPTSKPQTNEELIAKHLVEGKALLSKGEPAVALRDHFEQALLIDPNQSEALELKLKAEEMVRQSQLVEVPTAPPVPTAPAASATPQPTVPPSVDTFGIARNPGETTADWRARSIRIRDRYNEARAALQRNELESSIARLESLERDQPNYQDTRRLLAEARASLRASAEELMANAARLEKDGDYVAALAQLTKAKQIDASLDIDESVRRIREQSLKNAEDAYSRARVYDARGRVPEAVALYDRAVQLLPSDHPNRRAAQDRLLVLRSKPQ